MISKLVDLPTNTSCCYVRGESSEDVLGFEILKGTEVNQAGEETVSYLCILHYFGELLERLPGSQYFAFDTVSDACLFANTILSYTEDLHPSNSLTEEIVVDVAGVPKYVRKYGAGVLVYGYNYEQDMLYISKLRGTKDLHKKIPKCAWTFLLSKQAAIQFAQEIKNTINER